MSGFLVPLDLLATDATGRSANETPAIWSVDTPGQSGRVRLIDGPFVYAAADGSFGRETAPHAPPVR